MKNWNKRGLAIKVNNNVPGWKSHAMVPTPCHIENSIWRIYFGARNEYNQSQIGYVTLDLNYPDQVIETHTHPILTPGRLGTFDDNGVLPSCCIVEENRSLMYTIGFKPGGTTRMDLFGGLATSLDGENFERWSESPILERNRINPFINTAPWVIKINEQYIMYYVSGVEWLNKDLPRYNIQIAHSSDGLEWKREGVVAIDFVDGENALARPYVIYEKGLYHMWFSSKGEAYKAKYATSSDGINWTRSSDFEFYGDLEGVDDEMVCYPVVILTNNQKFMFYNGNGYGIDGICLAIEE